MKKIISLLLLTVSAGANELVYCPAYVDCSHDGDVESCEFEQHPVGYWSRISPLQDPSRLMAGEYRVSYVSAPYHIEEGGYAICVYTHTAAYQTLMLRARAGVPLVIVEGPGTAWRREESWGECKPFPAEACPLQLESGVFPP